MLNPGWFLCRSCKDIFHLSDYERGIRDDSDILQ